MRSLLASVRSAPRDFGPTWAAAEDGAETHGMSVFGDLKYPADFQHFDYVNVAAPKGGLFSLIPSVRAFNQSFFTFNSLNAYILKGEGAQGMDMTFVTLMVARERRARRDVRSMRQNRCGFHPTSSPTVFRSGPRRGFMTARS